MSVVRRVSSGLGLAILATAIAVVWIGIGRFVVSGQREDLELAVGMLVFLVLVIAVVAIVVGRRGGGSRSRQAAIVPLLPAAFFGVDLGTFEGALCALGFLLLFLFLVAWALGRGWRAGRGR